MQKEVKTLNDSLWEYLQNCKDCQYTVHPNGMVTGGELSVNGVDHIWLPIVDIKENHQAKNFDALIKGFKASSFKPVPVVKYHAEIKDRSYSEPFTPSSKFELIGSCSWFLNVALFLVVVSMRILR
jgi:hypothetical protein